MCSVFKIKLKKQVKLYSLLFFMFANSSLTAQVNDTVKSAYNYSLKERTEVNISTSLLKEKITLNTPPNVIIITKQMIEEKGKQTLVDVCHDVPGFDFSKYNDRGGEYPRYIRNKEIGKVGNPKALILINGIEQNNVSFTWSLMRTFDHSFFDVKQIEVVQGHGSVIYGAQVFTVAINMIMDDYNPLYNPNPNGFNIPSTNSKNIFRKYFT